MNARSAASALPLLALSLVACSGEAADKGASSAAADQRDSAAAASSPMKVRSLTGFKTPESVRYDAEMDVYFVSNINGNPSVKDNNGLITRVAADGDTTMTIVAEGGKNGVTLNAPKGIAIVGDTLWVADIDAVRAFNKKTGALIASVPLRGATFANDVVAGPDGSIYITDTGIVFDAQGATTHPGKDQVYKIAGRAATVALAGDSLGAPNGITWDGANQRFLIAGFGSPALLAWKPGDAKPTTVATGPGQYDGLEVLADGRTLVTSWADSSVNVVAGSGMTRLIGAVDGPADIGVDTKRNRVAIPRFSGNAVDIYSIGNRESWREGEAKG